ncbi:uncharacterized protein EDB93DRAFT_1269129 [Suillus bovinus]|uniref:uncharacterized protein n=1 Tax=Suillus bovinus TaxID=48563 RepID=UPI001B869292|nr:uncharacterized protein EDB93DRAFT_1269129 [Suillus bovinus]KAG2154152.1 hypothetical protein EDB93DRAFT_1269129 [Suillus bovinus]
MATPQVTSILPITDAQLPQSSSATFIKDMTSNGTSIYPQPHTRSPPLTATSDSNENTIGMGPMSSSIHNGANLILDLIRTERQQAFEVGQRQISHLQQQHKECRVSYSKVVLEESNKRRDAEDKVAYLSNELARYTKGATEVQNIALQARVDATTARNTASEAERAADEARSHLMAVQDALQRVGIAVSQDDSVTSNTPKIILSGPWLQLIPSQIHSSDTSLPDPSSAPDDKPSSSPSPSHHISSPSTFISTITEHISHLSNTLTAAQNSCKDLDAQRNQLQSDLRKLCHDRNELESLKMEAEHNTELLGQWKFKLTKLENETQLLKVERDDAVKAKAEAAIALEETRTTSAASAATLKSNFDQLFQDQQRQAEANAEKIRQAGNSIETKSVQIRDLQNRLMQITVIVKEWEGKYDAVTKERDSEKQLMVAERQKYKEHVNVETCDAVDADCTSRECSVQKERIDDLQKQIGASVSKDVMMAKVSRIEELEKELTSIQAHYAKSNQERDEAVALVKSRDAQIKELQEKLAVSSSRKLTKECAPKKISGGSFKEKKASLSRPSVPHDQIQFRAPEAHPEAVSTADQRSKQITGSKKIGKLKSKSSSTAPGFSATRPMEIDSASSTDVEIISGPIPIISQDSNTKQKSLRTGSNKTPLGVNTTQTVDSPADKTSLKRTADTNDTSTPATKRPKLFLDSSASSVEKPASALSSSPISTPLGSRSVTSSPVIAKPVFNFKFRKHSARASTSGSSGGVTSSKAMASSPNIRTSKSVASTEGPSVGASDGGAYRRSVSITSETELAAESTLGAKPRARLLRHGQIKSPVSIAGEVNSSKRHAEFKNFNPDDIPAKEQPSGSPARSTTVSAEQPQNTQAPASATISREASSSASTKSRPSLLCQFSIIDNPLTPPSNSTPSPSLSTASENAVDRSKANSSRDTISKGTTQPAGAKSNPKGPRSSMAMLQVTLESSPKAPNSMLAARSSGKVPQRPRATMKTPNTGDIKKST